MVVSMSSNKYASFVTLNKHYSICVLQQRDNIGEYFVSKEQVLGKKPVAILEKIRENLEQLNEKIEVMIELQKQDRKNLQLPIQDAPLDVMTLLSMPDHLRKTAMTVCRSGRATADEIAQQTTRARAVESAYLNQLVLMGYLKKERNGRKAYFHAERDNEGGR